MTRRAPPLRNLALAGALVLASPGVARAQSGSERAALAQGLYDSAAELIRAGKHAQACPKLEESQRLDPALGTQFFLAACYESTGRPTRAWSLFLEVAAASKAAGNAVRENTARARAAALEPKLPRITVLISEATAALPGLEVVRDGVVLKPVAWSSPIPVDLGAHTVRATAPGRISWVQRVDVTDLGQRLEVRVPLLAVGAGGEASPPPTAGAAPLPESAGAQRDPAPGAPTVTDRPLPPQRIVALLVGSAGVAGVASGAALGLLARSAWNQADAACPTHLACSPDAHDQSTRALSLATGSTIAFVASGAGVAAALALWFTASKPAPASSARLDVVPVGGPRAAGAFVAGRF